MSTTKVYYCHLCELKEGSDIGPFNRKQYFRHCKSKDHKDKLERMCQKMPPSTVRGVIEGQSCKNVMVRVVGGGSV